MGVSSLSTSRGKWILLTMTLAFVALIFVMQSPASEIESRRRLPGISQPTEATFNALKTKIRNAKIGTKTFFTNADWITAQKYTRNGKPYPLLTIQTLTEDWKPFLTRSFSHHIHSVNTNRNLKNLKNKVNRHVGKEVLYFYSGAMWLAKINEVTDKNGNKCYALNEGYVGKITKPEVIDLTRRIHARNKKTL